MLKHYARKRTFPRCIMKIHLQKAYDTVHWEFFRDALRLLNFPPMFISWIMECVCTTSFSISFNGQLHGFFKGARGLRQGDPLYPFLFVICMEILSRSLLWVSRSPDFNFHPRCALLHITYLVYADDLLILSRSDVMSVRIFLECVDSFGRMAGLRANVLKSNIYMAGG
ncbi:secreted RxLR effector protein 78-like [Primulina eburnea]|uniref:secreted RxLR effector protein 78-like n=1 Tax=Primulina eburnea TaxID=1245227 RepID=UPI003C6C2DD5